MIDRPKVRRLRSTPITTGFALLGVLWIIIGLSVVALAMGRVSWRAITTAQTERDRTVGRWLADGCQARFRSAANESLSTDPTHAAAAWGTLDRALLDDHPPVLTGCDITMRTAGRVVLDRADASALDTLPGISLAAIAHILQFQQTGTAITNLVMIESILTPSAKQLLDTHYQDLLKETTTEPDVWVVRARAHAGPSGTPVNIEMRLVRAGTRVAVVRWIEW